MQSTPFVSSTGETRNPFYEGQFEGETAEQAEARLHWAKVAMEMARNAALSAPSHGEQVRELPPFAQKVISKLKRFEECASDSDAGGVDIGRHWLDLLTQLGLLNRVQRSPGLWEISQQGEDVLAAAPSACSCGEPDVAGTHRKDGPCYWGPSAPSAGSKQGGE